MRKLSMFCLLLSAAIGARAQITFTASSTWTVPAGVTSATIAVVGAGGNGGGNGGSGGGGGGYASGVFTVVPGTVHTITIGAGGSGPATSISGLPIQATTGGNGGSSSQSGGAGGVGSGGTVNRVGGMGGNGTYTYFGAGGGGAAGPTANGAAGGSTPPYNNNCLTPGGAGGLSGGAPGGAGGKGAGFSNNTCSVTDPGTAAGTYGGGGGGGNGIGSVAGPGAGGFVSINWCSANTPAPTGQAMQHFCGYTNPTVANLQVTGSNIQWYATATGGAPLPITTALVDMSHYYVSQTVNGCPSSTRLDVMAHVTTFTAAATLSSNGKTLNATPVVGAAYRWITCPALMTVPNQTGASFTPTANGSYALVVMLNDCSDTSNCITVTGLGVGSTPADDGFRISPNPVTDMMVVAAPAGMAGQPYSLTDAAGRVLRTGRLGSGITSIAVADLPAGTYFFLAGAGREISLKVIKE